MYALRSIGAENQVEVLLDGGVRRGSDIFKAIALGAKGVGIGRPILYGLSAYGEAGVSKVVDMLKDELENTMENAGTPSISDIHERYVDIRSLRDHSHPPTDSLGDAVYEPLRLLSSRL